MRTCAGLVEGGFEHDPLLARIVIGASAITYDWITPLMLNRPADARRMRHRGTDEINPHDLYRSLSESLLATTAS